MGDHDRAHQVAGNYTELEKKEMAFHEASTNLINKQIALIKVQKRYGNTIRCATIVTAIATVVMAIAIIVQCAIMFNANRTSHKQITKPNTQLQSQATQDTLAKKP